MSAPAPAVPEKLRRLLEWAVQVGASDLHPVVGYPPVVRLNGDLTDRIGKAESIDNYPLTGRDEGMVSFDESVRQLLRAAKTTRETAEKNVTDATVLYR